MSAKSAKNCYRHIFVSLFLLIVLIMTSCASGTSIGSGLTSDDFLKGTDSKEGVYTLSSLVYQLPDLTPSVAQYDYYGVLDGKLYGFDFRAGAWDLIGDIEEHTLTAEDIAERLNESYINKDRADDPRVMLLKADASVTSENGIVYYCHFTEGIYTEGVMAEEKNGKIRAVFMMGQMDQFPENILRCLKDEKSAVPTRLTMCREARTFTLSVPAVDLNVDGTFHYTDDRTVKFQKKNGTVLMILQETDEPSPYGISYEYVEGKIPGDYFQSGMTFQTPGASVAFLDLWGTEEIDLNGDGKKETVFFGDKGFSGPGSLTISVDSKGNDAYVSYYATFRSISFRKEGKRLYVDTIYQPFHQEETLASFEVCYDGNSVWLEDENGIPLDEGDWINR